MFEEVGERAGNGAIILDEPSIEISETQKVCVCVCVRERERERVCV